MFSVEWGKNLNCCLRLREHNELPMSWYAFMFHNYRDRHVRAPGQEKRSHHQIFYLGKYWKTLFFFRGIWTGRSWMLATTLEMRKWPPNIYRKCIAFMSIFIGNDILDVKVEAKPFWPFKFMEDEYWVSTPRRLKFWYS